jgi:tetratricopeptide (TPR) repeat protein
VAPQKADTYRLSLYQRFGVEIEDQLKQTRLKPEDIAALENAISWLDKRDPARAETLRVFLRTRQSTLVTLFELSAPFSELGNVLDAGVAETSESLLVLKPSPNRKPGELIKTRVACAGSVALRASFAPSWEDASQIGLGVHQHEGQGYGFLLKVPSIFSSGKHEEGRSTELSFKEVKARQGFLSLLILRNGKVLREQEIKATDLAQGMLHLVAGSDAGRLTFQVNSLPSLDFQDGFPLSGSNPGVFGLYWPAGIPLESLQASRLLLPRQPSALEKGDELFARGPAFYPQALEFYEKHALVSAGQEIGQEAKYKAGLCHEKLRHYEEAAKIYQSLFVEPGKRWPLLAGLQLFLIHLRQNKLGDADDVIKKLAFSPELFFGDPSGRGRLEELASMVPDEVIQEIWRTVFANNSGINMVKRGLLLDLRYVDLAEQLVPLENYLHFPAKERVILRVALALLYRIAGRNSDAAQAYELVMEKDWATATQMGVHLMLVNDYCWLLNEMGGAPKALEVVNRYLVERPGAYQEANLVLLNTRARVYAALGQWDRAEKDVEEFLHRMPPERMAYPPYANACLMRGFLRERRGDTAGALEAWRQGLFKSFPHEKKLDAASDPLHIRFMMVFGYGLLLGSLANELSDEDIEDLFSQVSPELGMSLPGILGRQLLSYTFSKTALRMLFQSQRAHEFARRLAFQQMSMPDFARETLVIFASAAFRGHAFSDQLTREQDELIWQLCGDGYDIYFKGHLSEEQLMSQLGSLLAIWTNSSPDPGASWKSAEASMAPSIRPRMAYVFGRRLVVLGKPKEAANLFRVALAGASPDSPVHRLAKAELDRLEKK